MHRLRRTLHIGRSIGFFEEIEFWQRARGLTCLRAPSASYLRSEVNLRISLLLVLNRAALSAGSRVEPSPNFVRICEGGVECSPPYGWRGDGPRKDHVGLRDDPRNCALHSLCQRGPQEHRPRLGRMGRSRRSLYRLGDATVPRCTLVPPPSLVSRSASSVHAIAFHPDRGPPGPFARAAVAAGLSGIS